MTGKTSDHLRKSFDVLLAELLKTIGSSRTTLRLDESKYGFHIDDVVAEAIAPGQNSLRGQISIDQRAAATAQWSRRTAGRWCRATSLSVNRVHRTHSSSYTG